MRDFSTESFPRNVNIVSGMCTLIAGDDQRGRIKGSKLRHSATVLYDMRELNDDDYVVFMFFSDLAESVVGSIYSPEFPPCASCGFLIWFCGGSIFCVWLKFYIVACPSRSMTGTLVSDEFSHDEMAVNA